MIRIHWLAVALLVFIVFPLISFAFMWMGLVEQFPIVAFLLSFVVLLGWGYVLYRSVKQESWSLIRLYLFFWSVSLASALYMSFINTLYVVHSAMTRLAFFLIILFNASYFCMFFPLEAWIGKGVYLAMIAVPLVMLAAGIFVRFRFKGVFY